MTLRTDILLAISQVHSGNREEGGRIADAALATFRTWLAENGLVVVPREATDEMLVLGGRAADDFFSQPGPYPRTKAVYRAMLSAAPATGLEGAADTMLLVREQTDE